MTSARLSQKTWMSMSEPSRTWPVQTLPISRGSEPGELAHQAEGLDAHVAEVLEALVALVHPGHRLDLVADLGVGGEVAGPVTVFDPELLGGLALGGEVFGLGPLVHHLGGEEGDLPPDAFVGHGEECADWAHRGGAGRDAAAGVAATLRGKSRVSRLAVGPHGSRAASRRGVGVGCSPTYPRTPRRDPPGRCFVTAETPDG